MIPNRTSKSIVASAVSGHVTQQRKISLIGLSINLKSKLLFTLKGNSGHPASITKNQKIIYTVIKSSFINSKKFHCRCFQKLGLSASNVFEVQKRELKLYLELH